MVRIRNILTGRVSLFLQIFVSISIVVFVMSVVNLVYLLNSHQDYLQQLDENDLQSDLARVTNYFEATITNPLQFFRMHFQHASYIQQYLSASEIEKNIFKAELLKRSKQLLQQEIFHNIKRILIMDQAALILDQLVNPLPQGQATITRLPPDLNPILKSLISGQLTLSIQVTGHQLRLGFPLIDKDIGLPTAGIFIWLDLQAFYANVKSNLAGHFYQLTWASAGHKTMLQQSPIAITPEKGTVTNYLNLFTPPTHFTLVSQVYSLYWQAEKQHYAHNILAFAGLLLIFIMTAIFMIVQKSLKPLENLTAKMKNYQVMAFQPIAANLYVQELQPLICAFNAMGHQLKDTTVSKNHYQHQEQMANRRQKELTTIFDAAPISIFYKDQHNKIVRANNFFCQLTGLTKMQLEGKNAFDLVPDPKIAAQYWQDDLQVIHSGQSKINILEPLLNNPHRWFLTHKVPFLDDHDQVTGIVCFSIEISGQIETEENLRRLTEALHQSTSGVAIADLEGNITYINLQYRQMLVAPADCRYNQPLFSGIDVPEIPNPLSVCLPLVKSGGTFHTEAILNPIANRPQYFNIRVKGLLDRHQQVASILMIIDDITREKSAILEKESLQAQMVNSAKLASLGELSAGIAHEINNPLFIIPGFLQEIHKLPTGHPNSNLLQSHLAKIDQAVEHIKAVVEELSRYSRADAPDLEITPIDAHHAIESIFSLIGAIFQNQNIRLEKDLQASQFFILGTFSQFQQIIINLINNAKDALEPERPGIIQVKTFNTPDGFCCLVTDNGHGMSAQTQQQIFNPFFTTKPIGQGTGIGLSILSTYINNFQGSIAVQSKINQGTQFTLTFPLAPTLREPLPLPPLSRATKIPLPDIHRALKNLHCLVVDDEEAIRELTLYWLNSWGVIADQVTNPSDFFNAAPTVRYDLILTDLNMPAMRGEEFLQTFRQTFNYYPKVILITGCIEITVQDFPPGTLDDIVYKPFKEEQLYEKIVSLGIDPQPPALK